VKAQHFDSIIVGGGLAGSVLALQYLKHGKSILIVDAPHLSLSSKVAAGIWNPIVFKRLTKSYLADDLIPYLNTFYEAAEILLQTHFIKNRPIIKFLKEQNEIDFWQKKIDGDMGAYLDQVNLELPYHKNIDDQAKAYAKVKQTGVLNTNVFLLSLQKYLMANHSLLSETFDYNALQINSDSVHYKNISADKVLFCEGYLVKDNPFFNYVPMKPVKGETIVIASKDAHIEDIINKHLFILPLGNDQYKVGATFNWDDLNDTPTETGIAGLENDLKALLKSPFTILKKEAGVRPAVIDRRPIIGLHPHHQNLGIFNGFGTKGVMLCPYLSEILYNFIFLGHNMSKEIDVCRFEHKAKITTR
jgi:glycine oxidase